MGDPLWRSVRHASVRVPRVTAAERGAHPLGGKVLAAYLTLSVVWGSTFLVNRIGVQHVPPALFSGARFLVAGLLLLPVALGLGHRLPSRANDWQSVLVVGILLLGGGNGLVVWGLQYADSGTAAVFVVTGAMWLAVIDALVPGSEAKVTRPQFLGLLVGFAGAFLLVGGSVEALRAADWRGPVAFTLGTISFAAGSVYSKRRPAEISPYMNSALQMLTGGLFLTVVGLVRGEQHELALSLPGLLAIAYLIVVGSVVGYSSFLYVLRHTPPTIAGTYMYVNTIFAVVLGWLVLGEPLTGRKLLAVTLVLGSVLWVRLARR